MPRINNITSSDGNSYSFLDTFTPISSHTSNYSYYHPTVSDSSDVLWEKSYNIPILNKKSKKESEKEDMNFCNSFVEIKNNKIFFKSIGQTLQDACNVLPYNDDFGTFGLVLKYGYRKICSEHPVIIFGSSFGCSIGVDIEKGTVYEIRADSFVPFEVNEFFKNYLKELFDGTNNSVYSKLDSVISSRDFKAIKRAILVHNKDIAEEIKGPKCSCCGENVEDFRFVCFRGQTKCVCDSCINSLRSCHRCGEYFFPKDGIETREGRWLCDECSKFKFVTPYHHYYPKIEFFGDNKNNSVPYLGLELEVDFGGESDRNAGIVSDILNKNKIFGYCSHDGSLSNGFEIITQPATMEYHNSIKHIYSDLMNKLKDLKYSSHNTTTCGLHVHFNRSFFGENDTRNLSKFIFLTEKFWNEIIVFSRRPEHRMERYAKKISPIPITEYINMGNKSGDHDYHYYSVNIANRDTIELRTFKGTLNVDTLLATLQLVNNMAIVAKEKTLSELQNIKFEYFLTTRYQKRYWERHSSIPDGEE